MTFSLYKARTGGTAVCTDTVKNVVVRDGLFTVLLEKCGKDAPIPASLFDHSQMFLGIKVGGNPEMTPRQQIHPVPYALQLTNGVFVSDGGQVGIGTTNPQSALDVAGTVRISSTDQETGLVIDRGDTNYTALRLTSSGPGWGSGLKLENTAAGKTYYAYTSGGGELCFGPEGPKWWTMNDKAEVAVGGARPVKILRYLDQGERARINTHVPASEWECVATGWSARWGDTAAVGDNSVWTRVVEGEWWAYVEFHDNGSHENPDVDILCFRKEIVDYTGDRSHYKPD
jgi:hypothetical protein